MPLRMTAFEVIRMWVVSHEVKSVVYVPLLRQGELVHLLYLENNLGSFISQLTVSANPLVVVG